MLAHRLALALALALALVPAVDAAWQLARVVEHDEFEAFDAASLNLYDFDRDGTAEIVSMNDNGHVYVIGLDSGRILARIGTTHPDGWNARDINPVAIGDLYGDGIPCLVIPNSAAYLAAWCYDGRTFGGGFDFERRWEIRVDAAQWEPDFHERRPWIGDQQPSIDGNAFLADVDGAPGLEVFVETDGYPGQLSFTHTGEHRWHTAWYDGNAGVVVHDLDLDGKKEAVFASDAGVVAVYDADTGDERWTFGASDHGAEPGSITLAPTVADIDGEPGLELVFAARGATGGVDGSHATWFALRADGSVLWQRSYDWMNPLAYNHPAALDVDGDGDTEVVALDWNTLGHKPGNWETTARGANLFALDGDDGDLVWRASVATYWSNMDLVVIGSGNAETPWPAGHGGIDGAVVIVEPQEGREGLARFDLATGERVGWSALPEGWQAMRGPVATDGGGGIRLVVPLSKPDPTPEADRQALDVGDRLGALAIVDARGASEVRFSANFLHAEGEVMLSGSGLRTVPLSIPLAIAAAACVAVFARRRSR